MRRFSSCRNDDKEVRRDGSCEDRPKLSDQVANGDKKNIGNVGNGSGSVLRGNRLNRMFRRISSNEWEDGEVLVGIGTFPIGSKCLADPFLVRKYSVQRL